MSSILKRKRDLRSEWGMACPRCGSADSMTLTISCSANLTINGTEPRGDHEWEPTSDCHCDECGHNGVVADFCIVDKAEPQSTGKLRFQDLACPRCAHRKDFHIDIGATGYLDATGVCVESDYHWDATSVCTCLGCQHEAPAAGFAKATEVRS